MSLTGKRVAQIKIKAKGDVFQNCKTHDGETGTVGCVLHWNYFHDGKNCVAKTLILDIDEEKKLTSFKIVEGDFLELYKNFLIYHMDRRV
uniref:MLP-like protein 34 n=1 Tax=Erigeron canadensis TaxID=72917 RepID=UPI001CB8CA9E|nr:MLP-like protein 34 [Erigeron canadensis]